MDDFDRAFIGEFREFKANALSRLDLILVNQRLSRAQGKLNMAELDEMLAMISEKMNAQTTVVDSFKPFIQGLFDQIKNTVPMLTPEQRAVLTTIQTGVEANTDKLAADMLANTAATAAPPPAA